MARHALINERSYLHAVIRSIFLPFDSFLRNIEVSDDGVGRERGLIAPSRFAFVGVKVKRGRKDPLVSRLVEIEIEFFFFK